MDSDESQDNSTETDAQAFIDRWSPSGGAERSNYQSFLIELCDLLGVLHPDPSTPDDAGNAYVFEKSIVFNNGDGTSSTKFADLYKRGAFICETKQGVEQEEDALLLSAKGQQRKAKRKSGHGRRGTKGYDEAMRKAHGQAASYARNLPAGEGRPPLLLVIDVGHSIELYSEFSQTGGAYVPFPDPRSHRIKLTDLADEKIRERLRLVWTDPLALDPARRTAKVTREIATRLAKLAKSLEAAEHPPEQVAHFLMRCLFTMFAEDVELLPKDSFRKMLESLEQPEHFQPVVEDLWRTMDSGGFNAQLRAKLLIFNGGLFKDPSAIAINRDQLDLLIEAATADWQDVEPAIFGTLLERALDPVERHKLGAHYTPRAYVERLVVPTVVEPLREEWDAARAAALTLARDGETKAAVAEIEAFHDRLCEVRVLDPACGSGNFLYVVLEHLKRLEGEVFAAYEEIAERQMLLESGHTVDPHQLLGIEINPRAAAIAELVLWIGYLQWHFRTRGNVSPPEPVIKNFQNIECRDAVLAYDSKEEVLDDEGQPVTIWDGRTTKPHPVTGLEVPDETARVPMYEYINPRKADWPEADFVVGNPPFVGNKRMKSVLGEGYVEAVRSAHSDLPRSMDYVMYWWHAATAEVASHSLERAGLIATSSITQGYNAKVVQQGIANGNGARIVYAVADHPWVDAAEGADVRIAITVFGRSDSGQLDKVVSDSGRVLTSTSGEINSQLKVGTNVSLAGKLEANGGLACPGVQLSGQGFLVHPEELKLFSSKTRKRLVKRYFTGRDLNQYRSERYVIDTFGMSERALRNDFPDAYQWLIDRVKPDRMQNPRKKYRDDWWLHSEPRKKFRLALNGLQRFIGTSRTSRHRTFEFLPINCLPETKVLVVASQESLHFGILCSWIHGLYSRESGGWLGVGNDSTYNHSSCFETFPFPDATEPEKQRIRELGEQLDAHRKQQQAKHEKLTMTGMYNVLEKLRGIEKGSGEELTAKEKTIHEQGLVSVLKQIHDDLDAAVADAYGWPVDLSDEEILERLVALNHERAEEEKRGLVRWLRPEFQNPDGQTQKGLEIKEGKTAKKKTTKAKIKKQPWPKTLSQQAAAVQTALAAIGGPADEADVAKRFTRAKKDRITELLETLESVGRARELEDGRYVAM